MPWRHVVNEMSSGSFTLDEFRRQGAGADLHADLAEAEQIMVALEELGLIRRIETPRGAPSRWVRSSMYVPSS